MKVINVQISLIRLNGSKKEALIGSDTFTLK
jgi:hypothetical protein